MPRPQIHVWRPPRLTGIELQWCHEVKVDVPTHFHDGYQLGLVLSGALEVRVGGRGELAEAGDMVLFDAREPHSMTGSEQTPVTALVLEIAEDRMRRSLDLEEGASSPRFHAAVVRDEEAADALRDLHQSLAGDDERERNSGLVQLEPLICHLVAEHGAPRSDTLDELRAEAVDEVQRYLDAHLSERLALDQLAESVGASKFQLIRCFKQRVGVPPLGYHMQRRVNRAKELLAEGRPIIDVAFDLGFADQSHLTRHFKRLTLMTPGDYARGKRPG